MVTCSKCQRRKAVEGAWKPNRGPIGKLCASCFDAEADKASVQYTLVNVTGKSWSQLSASITTTALTSWRLRKT